MSEVCVCVCPSHAIPWETVEVIIVKLGKMTASAMRMHHVLVILTLIFIDYFRTIQAMPIKFAVKIVRLKVNMAIAITLISGCSSLCFVSSIIQKTRHGANHPETKGEGGGGGIDQMLDVLHPVNHEGSYQLSRQNKMYSYHK